MQNTELPEKIEPTSLNFQTELAAKLAELVPEALSDGKLDVTKLREMVNGDAENSPEKFGLFWPGKRAAQALAQIPTTATLIPAPEESVDWENTKNVFIEGDNLEVLKALQNSYRRKVKIIYIDPPYNTGKEFIYPDKFSEGLQGYLEYTGQKNEAGENIESKLETGGRRHSNWLSMMYPRLQLAKSLLKDDGAIFVSIDNYEVDNLRKLLDEVFGEENFVCTFVWLRKTSPKGVPPVNMVVNSQEYILCYSRTPDFKFLGVPRSMDGFSNPDNDPRGPWRNTNIKSTIKDKSTAFSIADPETGNNFTDAWAFSKTQLQMMIDSHQIIFPRNKDGQVRAKEYFNEFKNQNIPIITFLDKYDGQSASDALTRLMGGKYFSNPKNVSLIERLIGYISDKEDIILDFFSGSGTTAESVMKLNAEDGGNRVHIQVQLPEMIDRKTEVYRAGFSSIADITKRRISLAGKKICEDYATKIAERTNSLDTGFRVYKLAPSNFVQWDENKAKDDIQQSVLDFAANKKPDTAPESLLAEIMLQARMPLSANIEKRDLQSGSWVYIVDGGNLIAYVANEQITEAQANEIADLAPAKLIVLDSAFNGNNALKINVANICKEKFIKEFKTI